MNVTCIGKITRYEINYNIDQTVISLTRLTDPEPYSDASEGDIVLTSFPIQEKFTQLNEYEVGELQVVKILTH